MATIDSEQQWPPRSPYEALLSSPSGRSRIRNHYDRTSPSPSPLKKSSIVLGSAYSKSIRMQPNSSLDGEDDEDEETLQLRLQALEAKLKLKQLQQKRLKKISSSSDVENEQPVNATTARKVPRTSTAEENDWKKLQPTQKLGAPQAVQVPASPQRKHATKDLPKSPSRVLLGIDKGLRGKNISLRRAPETRDTPRVLDDPFLEDALRVKDTSQWSSHQTSSNRQNGSTPKAIGFSARIAEIRQRDKEQADRAKTIQRQKTSGFGIKKEDLQLFTDAADEEAKVTAAFCKSTSSDSTFSREEVLKAAKKPNNGLVHRNDSSSQDPTQRRKRDFKNPNASPDFVKPTVPPAKPHSEFPSPEEPSPRATKNIMPADDSFFEPFSSFHLSKRLIPHDSLTKALSGKSILLLPDILAAVKAPEYSFPDNLESDVVVLAILGSKSDPLTHKDRHKTSTTTTTKDTTTPVSSHTEAAESAANNHGKYLALTLTDLKWSLDLYLFTTAYTRFRRLTPGTVIAILNPSIMPPPPHNPHNNRFSLTLNSNEDTVLEVGRSRDLGWCKAVKKDGKQCDTWIDKRHTSVCEYHVETVVEKTRRGRMEVNSMSVPFAPGGKGRGGRSGFWGGGKGRINSKDVNGFTDGKGSATGGYGGVEGGRRYDRSSKSTFVIGGPSTASLLDGNDLLTDRGGREERVRKRMAEREREREIARKLGEKGNGMGGEYLKAHHTQTPSTMTVQAKDDISSQDKLTQAGNDEAMMVALKGNKAVNVQLSPIKKKRVGDIIREEGRRKKTRFLTEKGVREAGRESLGVVADGRGEEEEDEELDIV
ncbi:MAG: hypothetical protein Q9220_000168 [cf. Caloplaca sp. 1 TL-2023]